MTQKQVKVFDARSVITADGIQSPIPAPTNVAPTSVAPTPAPVQAPAQSPAPISISASEREAIRQETIAEMQAEAQQKAKDEAFNQLQDQVKAMQENLEASQKVEEVEAEKPEVEASQKVEEVEVNGKKYYANLNPAQMEEAKRMANVEAGQDNTTAMNTDGKGTAKGNAYIDSVLSIAASLDHETRTKPTRLNPMIYQKAFLPKFSKEERIIVGSGDTHYSPEKLEQALNSLDRLIDIPTIMAKQRDCYDQVGTPENPVPLKTN